MSKARRALYTVLTAVCAGGVCVQGSAAQGLADGCFAGLRSMQAKPDDPARSMNYAQIKVEAAQDRLMVRMSFDRVAAEGENAKPGRTYEQQFVCNKGFAERPEGIQNMWINPGEPFCTAVCGQGEVQPRLAENGDLWLWTSGFDLNEAAKACGPDARYTTRGNVGVAITAQQQSADFCAGQNWRD